MHGPVLLCASDCTKGSTTGTVNRYGLSEAQNAIASSNSNHKCIIEQTLVLCQNKLLNNCHRGKII